MTAETIKYASNAFLATKLSFVNALASLCESVGADVRDLILGLGYDKRIGFEFLRPGPGWGGSCLPKDTSALVHIAETAGYDFALLRAAIATNDEQLDRVVAKVAGGGRWRRWPGRTVAVWGLTFKAGTDDRRQLAGRRRRPPAARPRCHRPGLRPDRRPLGARSATTWPAWCCAATPTRRPEAPGWRSCSPSGRSSGGSTSPRSRDLMAVPSVVDARNLLDPAALRRLGFTYTGVGRP